MNLKIDSGWMLGQGTIYPDTIETGGTKHADHIKTHHNRVDAVQKMIDAGLVIEPLKELYKDEVRQLGEDIGLPHELVWRHPFPGPGLGVRILCGKEEERGKMKEESNNEKHITHAVLPVRSVGVQGDGRTYRHALAVFSDRPCHISEEYLKLATTIPNSDPAINRVLLCTSRPDIHPFIFTPGYLTRERADLLREADSIVHEEMEKAGLYEKIWQFPVVLLPFGTSVSGQSIVLRPIVSTDAMTANAMPLPEKVLQTMTEKIMALDGIDLVFIDLTNKPPATIEWE
jgi:GMP synthase (glutamine-hydrolysing)